MKMAYHFTNGIVLALWLLVRTQPSASSLKIRRGERDMVSYGKDYDAMINHTNEETMICNSSLKSCECKENGGFTTLIYNTNTKIIKCVKDEDMAIELIGYDGMYLTKSNGVECLRVEDHKMYNCSKNDLSLRWIWIQLFHIMNLKTLKCLQWNNDAQEFTAEQCVALEKTQQVIEIQSGKFKLKKGNARNISLYYNTSNVKKSQVYKGCYRVSEDKMIGVIKESDCKGQSRKNCNISITINAPIVFQKSSRCVVHWEKSNYSVFGQTWTSFPVEDQNLFTLDRVNKETHVLNISSDGLFTRWSGTLIKLRLNCTCGAGRRCSTGIEKHCVLLKIEGAWKNNTQSSIVSPISTSSFVTSSFLTSSFVTQFSMTPSLMTLSSTTPFSMTPSSMTLSSMIPSSMTPSSMTPSSMTPLPSSMTSSITPFSMTPSSMTSSSTTSSSMTTSSSPVETSSEVSSMLFAVPIIVIFCLLIAAFVMVVYCRRRRKRLNSKQDCDLYEDSTARNPIVSYEDPTQLIEMNRRTPNPYESPGVNILVGNHYEYPTNGPTQKDTRNNNEFHYDYATREETNLLPLILNGDAILVDDTSGPPHNGSGSQKPHEKRDPYAGQSHQKTFYHTLEEEDKSHEKRDFNDGQSNEKPFYHTLDEDVKSQKKRDSHAGQSYEKPFYHSLEEDTSDVSYPLEERDAPAKNTREQPFYHTLENSNE